MTTPILGLAELAASQAVPETTVNENNRWLEFFAAGGKVLDRDLATPPGSPADGAAYLVAASPTGAWAGQAGKIALRISTAWAFKSAQEGMLIWIADEDLIAVYRGAYWISGKPVTLASGPTITPDLAQGFNFDLDLAENATLANPNNAKVGDSGIIVVQQDGTGGLTLGYGSDWLFPGGAPTLSTDPLAVDAISYRVVATGVILCSFGADFQ